MQGRIFLNLARECLVGADEVHWRGAAGRAYYALMLEGREALFRWGFRLLPRENVHAFVRFRFLYAVHADLRKIGRELESGVQLRNQADYDLSALPQFASDVRALETIRGATAAIDLLDAIEADPARKAAVIAAIRVAFP